MGLQGPLKRRQEGSLREQGSQGLEPFGVGPGALLTVAGTLPESYFIFKNIMNPFLPPPPLTHILELSDTQPSSCSLHMVNS